MTKSWLVNSDSALGAVLAWVDWASAAVFAWVDWASAAVSAWEEEASAVDSAFVDRGLNAPATKFKNYFCCSFVVTCIGQ
jgi:hypothetical protein